MPFWSAAGPPSDIQMPVMKRLEGEVASRLVSSAYGGPAASGSTGFSVEAPKPMIQPRARAPSQNVPNVT